MFGGNLANLLIVESENGQVYFVEDEKQEPKLDKIRRKKRKIEDERRQKNEELKKIENEELEMEKKVKQEMLIEESIIKIEPYESLSTSTSMATIPSFVNVKVEISEPSTSVKNETFTGNWSDDDEPPANDFSFVPPSPEQPKSIPRRTRAKLFRENLTDAEKLAGGVAFGKHKMRKLVGVPACRYCDSIFIDRKERNAHDCEYLKCKPGNFICRICSKELSTKSFSNHVHEAAACQYCGKKVLNPRQMKKHIKALHKGEKYKPPVERDLSEVEKYIEEKRQAEAHVHAIREQRRQTEDIDRLNHLHSYRKNPRYECDMCGRREPSKREMLNHINMHLDIPLGVCPKCGLKIFTTERMRKHSCTQLVKPGRRPQGSGPKHCRFCGVTFETAQLNKAHECEYISKIDPKYVICRFCNRNVSRSDFAHHMERHRDDPNECHVCNQKFLYKRGLRVHMRLHTGEQLFKCDMCSSSFNYKQNYDHHMKTHGVTSGKNIPCEYCGKSFSSDVTLKNHHAKAHEIGIKCDTCRAPMESREELLKHLTMVHGPVRCEHCNAVFLEPKKLKLHERKHYDQDSPSRTACPYCSRRMIRGRLRRHIFKEHHQLFEAWSASQSEVV